MCAEMRKDMSKPIVAIVGRPNVGKSTLFNMIAGERIAIVKDTPGVTRDRIYAEVSWLNHNFTLMDTGGIEPETSNQMLRSMREQAEMAIEMADVVMFVVDVQQGVLDADYKVADMLRKAHKDIVLVVNKVDNYDKMLPDVYEFYNLGIGDPHPISSLNKMGLGDMLDEVTALFPKDLEEEEDERPRIAIVGKPNVGKSSLINMLTNKKGLAMTSQTPGKTLLINHFLINNEWYLVDLPGYGFAQRGKENREQLKRIIENYILDREQLTNLFVLLDCRHEAQKIDLEFMEWLGESGVPFSIIFTKIDKISKGRLKENLKVYTDKLLETWEELPPIFLSSSEKKEGRDEILDYIESINNSLNN